MKKIISISLFAIIGFSIMSVAPSSNSNLNGKEIVPRKMKLVTFICPNGYSFEYYDNVPGYTDEDYADMQNAVCNDPDNQL